MPNDVQRGAPRGRLARPVAPSTGGTGPAQGLLQTVHTDALSPLVFRHKRLDQILTEMSDTPAG